MSDKIYQHHDTFWRFDGENDDGFRFRFRQQQVRFNPDGTHFFIDSDDEVTLKTNEMLQEIEATVI